MAGLPESDGKKAQTGAHTDNGLRSRQSTDQKTRVTLLADNLRKIM